MKTLSKLALAAVACGFALPAMAESIDLGAASCADIAALDANTVATVLLWMDGYTGGVMGDSTFDADRLKQNVDDASKACEAAPDRPLLDVMKEVVGG